MMFILSQIQSEAKMQRELFPLHQQPQIEPKATKNKS